MANLSDEQKEFLAKYKIPESLVFDATGMRTLKYKKIMSEMGYLVAIGVTPCGRRKHTLRTKYGACAQCYPENLNYARRHYINGFIYLAESKKFKLVKIGMGANLSERIKQLNHEVHAGTSDWAITFSINCDNVGRIESEIHRKLFVYKVKDKTYYKDSDEITSREVFNCTYETAKSAIEEVTGKKMIPIESKNNRSIDFKRFYTINFYGYVYCGSICRRARAANRLAVRST